MKTWKADSRHKINGEAFKAFKAEHTDNPNHTIISIHQSFSLFLCFFLVSDLYSKVGRWYIATEYSGRLTEMHHKGWEDSIAFLAVSSGPGCHQVCGRLEPADRIKIITQPSQIAVFILGNCKSKSAKDTNYINFRNKNVRESKYSHWRKTYTIQRTSLFSEL